MVSWVSNAPEGFLEPTQDVFSHFWAQLCLSVKEATCGLYCFMQSGQYISTCGLKNEPHMILLLPLKARAHLPGHWKANVSITKVGDVSRNQLKREPGLGGLLVYMVAGVLLP